MAKKEIRFSVSNQKGLTSATWVCVSPKGKDDIYLACRELKGAIKVSLHESGRWRVAWDKEFLDKDAPQGSPLLTNRIISNWKEPEELCPGVILAFRILVPDCAIIVPKRIEQKPIFWIPAPPKGWAIEISMFLTYPEAKLTAWPGAGSMKTALVGKIELKNMKKVWVVYREIKLPPIKILNGGKARLFGKSEVEGLKTNGLRAILIAADEYGSRCFLESIIKKES